MRGRRAQRALLFTAVFCFGLALALVSMVVAFSRTLSRPGYQDEVLESSGYYEELTQTIRTGCASILAQAGMPEAQTEQILDLYVTHQTVRTAVQEHIDALYSGYSQSAISTAYFPQAIHTMLDLFEEGTGLYPEPEINLALVSAHASCEYYFHSEVTVPFSNAVSVMMQYSDSMMLPLAAVALLTVGSLALMFRLSGDLRELAAGCAASCLAAAVGCAALGGICLLTDYESWMAPGAEAAAFAAWLRGFLIWLPACGALWLAAAGVLLWLAGRAPRRAEEGAPASGGSEAQSAPADSGAGGDRAGEAPAEEISKAPPEAAAGVPTGREIRTDRAARIFRAQKP